MHAEEPAAGISGLSDFFDQPSWLSDRKSKPISVYFFRDIPFSHKQKLSNCQRFGKFPDLSEKSQNSA